MHDTFVPLAEFLRASDRPAPDFECGDLPEESVTELTQQAEPADLEEALAEIRRFRASLADAVDARVERLMCEIASSVLARELRAAPADIRAVVIREVELAGEPPVRVRVHPDECDCLEGCALTFVADATLHRGDVVLELRSGTISATLGCRLARVLTSVSAS